MQLNLIFFCVFYLILKFFCLKLIAIILIRQNLQERRFLISNSNENNILWNFLNFNNHKTHFFVYFIFCKDLFFKKINIIFESPNIRLKTNRNFQCSTKTITTLTKKIIFIKPIKPSLLPKYSLPLPTILISIT
jgi:hypothetical protein